MHGSVCFDFSHFNTEGRNGIGGGGTRDSNKKLTNQCQKSVVEWNFLVKKNKHMPKKTCMCQKKHACVKKTYICQKNMHVSKNIQMQKNTQVRLAGGVRQRGGERRNLKRI